MLDELYKYNFTKKSKSDLASDAILNNIYHKMWDDRGYTTGYYLGVVNQLKSMIKGMRDDHTFSQKDLLMLLASSKNYDETPDEIKSLIDDILEECNYKET